MTTGGGLRPRPCAVHVCLLLLYACALTVAAYDAPTPDVSQPEARIASRAELAAFLASGQCLPQLLEPLGAGVASFVCSVDAEPCPDVFV